MEASKYIRRCSRSVRVGALTIGGDAPIRLQSMANVSTMDTDACVRQALECAQAGCDLFRYTVQGEREARNLSPIVSRLRSASCAMPLVADIHFNRKPAFEALKYVEKVRINPGNFADSRARFQSDPLLHIQEVFTPFIEEARLQQRAIRIGVNHGSLSPRILEQWGNTPEGMVQSCLEYIALCQKLDFHEVVISMKSSNVQVMTQAVHRLITALQSIQAPYPLHLGVTEAGSGEDGRIKSAVGIGSLLMDGIGDTIRVSLSEDPLCEIEFGKKLISYVERVQQELRTSPYAPTPAHLYSVWDRATSELSYHQILGKDLTPIVYIDPSALSSVGLPEGVYPIAETQYVEIDTDREDAFNQLDALPESRVPLMLTSASPLALYRWRKIYEELHARHADHPIILHFKSAVSDPDMVLIESCLHLGSALLQGMGHAVMLSAPALRGISTIDLPLAILQATRLRTSHTEFISCPGCGRTLFDLQSVVQDLKQKLSHLPNLKIGIMGCIVNGPGEMADADYGFVGGAVGKVDLYIKQHCVQRGIPYQEAIPRLIEIIRENGDWIEPPLDHLS